MLMFCNLIPEHVAPGLHVKSATTLPSFPELVPEMLMKLTFVMLTFDGYCAHVVLLILK